MRDASRIAACIRSMSASSRSRGAQISTASCTGALISMPRSVARQHAKRSISAPFACIGKLRKERSFACAGTCTRQPNTVCLALGATDMLKGFDGLSLLAQEVLREDPFSGHLFVFRGKRGDLIKVLYWDGQGLCLFAKRLERGRFIWPQAREGTVTLSPAQLAMLLEGIDWRAPLRTWVLRTPNVAAQFS